MHFQNYNNINFYRESTDHPLNVSLMNQFLRNSVGVTLQRSREPGAVYRVSISPETPHTIHNSTVISLTISYDIQYNVSIVSSLCGVTTTRVLKYGKSKNVLNIIACKPIPRG